MVPKVSPWLFLGEGNGTPLQSSCLENPMDGGAWWAAVHGVTKSRTRLSDFTCTFHFHALEKKMATHSSVLAWRIPGTGEPGGLLSMGSHRVGHDWSDLAAVAAADCERMNFCCLSLAQHVGICYGSPRTLSQDMGLWAPRCGDWPRRSEQISGWSKDSRNSFSHSLLLLLLLSRFSRVRLCVTP